MWIVSLAAAGSLLLFVLISSLIRKKKPKELFACLKRTPYEIIPFVLSMFVIVIVLNDVGVTGAIGKFLGDDLQILRYGTLSTLAANLVNNIPMSVFFSSIIAESGAGIPAVFATIIGSNIGAFLTPIGALAGIMWSNIIHKQGVKFGYADFLKTGALVAIPCLFASLGGLWLAVSIF